MGSCLSCPDYRFPELRCKAALALRFEQLLREGHVASYAELARLGHVTQTRISQIMNLLYMAPDIQEEILFLPRTQRGRDPILLRNLQQVAAALDWRHQRRRWGELLLHKGRRAWPR
ncbi:MAG TPA: hypothetical protein VMF69_26340 [Gemmataceae bacterium]|nr:hypothetical protein [Gemmataceae bacterium]